MRRLASLPLAIGELAAIAGLSAVGTVVEQGKELPYYQQFYPETGSGLSSLVTWRFITALGIDHVYTTPLFAGLCALLAASLAACTAVRQLPAARVARDWRFATSPSAVRARARGAKHLGAGALSAALPAGRARDLGAVLATKGYQVFVKEVANGEKGGDNGGNNGSPPSLALYAFKGMAGKLGPVAVHASLLLIIAGAAGGAAAGWRGSALAPEGSSFGVATALNPATRLAPRPAGAAALLRVDDFRINYRDDGSVAQFESGLSVLDPATGALLAADTISVNKPLRFRGVTVYQADYGMAAVTMRVEGAGKGTGGAASTAAAAATPGTPLNLPMAELKDAAGVKGRAWATFLPLEDAKADAASTTPRGLTILARDFQAVAVYAPDGTFAGVRRPGSGTPLTVEGVTLTIDAIVGSTGLELKADPGVPYVYAGFALLMVSTLVSYASHSQVWALQAGSGEGRVLHVSGKTNRAALGFGAEMDAALAAVPEVADG